MVRSGSRMEMVRELLNKDPKDPFLRYAYALELASSGNLNEAIEHAKKLLEDEPDYLGAYYQLGKWYEQKGDTGSAMTIYREGRKLAEKEENKKTFGELTEAMMMLDEFDEDDL